MRSCQKDRLFLSACLAELIRYISCCMFFFKGQKSTLNSGSLICFSLLGSGVLLISSACFQSVSQYSGPLTVHCNTPYRSPVSEPNPSEEEEAPNVVHAPPDL